MKNIKPILSLSSCFSLLLFIARIFRRLRPAYHRLARITLIVGLPLLSTSLFAQKNEGKVVLQSNGVGIAYERLIATHSAIQVSILRISKTKKSGGLAGYSKPTYDNDAEGLFLEYRNYFFWNQTPLNGLYFSPNIAVQNHRLTYRQQTGSTYGGWSDLFSVPIYATGEKKVSTLGTGIKLGHQKNADELILDFGINLFWNHVIGNDDPVILENGEQRALFNDINGFSILLSFGLGLAF